MRQFISCIWLAVWMSAMASQAVQAEGSTQEMEKATPSQDEYSLKLDPFSIDPADVPPTYRYPIYRFVECRVSWDQHCSGNYTLAVPAGWQVCQVLYRITEENERRGMSVAPADVYPNDFESPPRFRAVALNIWAKGSGNIFDKYGSVIRLEDVGLQIIDAGANNEQRFAAGCWMPQI